MILAIALMALGIYPPAQDPGRTWLWLFDRTTDGVPEQWKITVSATDLRETWTSDDRMIEDTSVLPLPPDQTLSEWFTLRTVQLTAEGWRLVRHGTTLDVPIPIGGWISGACP